MNNTLVEMYSMGQYNKIIDMYDKNKNKEYRNDELTLFAGLSFTDIGLHQKAIDCLTCINLDKYNKYIGMVYRYIGVSNFALGNYDLARLSFDCGIKWADQESLLWKKLLFSDLYCLNETKYIIFRFVDVFSKFEIKLFIYKCMESFDRVIKLIAEFSCGKKIDIYMYIVTDKMLLVML